MSKRKICYVTGSRADFGLLSLLIEESKKNRHLHTQIIATGSHFSKAFGNSYEEILEHNKIDKKVKIIGNKSSEMDVIKSISNGITRLSIAYKELKPDLLVVLGDRYEILSACIAALILNIPIAHIHGGELSYGSFDDSIRHSITKMSHLHFTSTPVYKKRVIKLGENPKRVFNVGSLGVENLKKIKLIKKKELKEILEINFSQRNLLLVFHPVTLDNKNSVKHLKDILSVLRSLKNTNIFLTKSNADPKGDLINKILENFNKTNKNSYIFATLGHIKFLSLLKCVDGIIGNSSSGIIEAPSLKVGSINIGIRQKGRAMAESIINCEPNKIEIKNAIKKLYSKSFIKRLNLTKNPYDKKNTSINILKQLEKVNLNKIILKKFYD
tara:strand:+ start:6384 stop:7535 length:1152 start_codon:yes stop_codon:yes gene_type:complete